MHQLLKHFKDLTLQPKNAQELKGLILQLAIQGKLTLNWRVENPHIEDATQLLKRIKKEKAQLIKEKKIKKEKSLLEITENDISFELPNKWTWCRLNDLGIIGSSSRVHQKDWQTEGVPFYRAREIVKLSKFGHVDNNLFISEELFAKFKESGSVPEKNDIMITGVGTIGIPYVVNKEDRFYFKDASVLILKNVFNLYTAYLNLFFISKYWINEIHKDSMGTTVHTLTISRAKIVPTILPPIEEQKEIVRVVEILFKEVEQLEHLTVERITLKEEFVTSALNQLITNNAKQEWEFLQDHFKSFFNETANIKKLRETVLQLAVQGKLTADWRANNPDTEDASILLKRIQKEKAQLIKDKKIKKEKPLPPIEKDEILYELPEGWVWCRFQEIFDIRDGTHDSPKNVSGPNSYPIVTSKDFKNGIIDLENAKRISKEDYDKVIQRSLVEVDDILFSMIGGNLGNQVMVQGNTEFAIKNVALFKYYKKSLSVPDFLKTFSEHIAYAVQEKASGGAQPFVSLTFLRQMLFPLPPLEEQKAIVQKVKALMGLCDGLEQEVQQSQKHYEQLMQSCLREVFEN